MPASGMLPIAVIHCANFNKPLSRSITAQMMTCDTIFRDRSGHVGGSDRSRSNLSACTRLLSLASRAEIHQVANGQVLSEYLVVLKRPVSVNGLGLAVDQAMKSTTMCRLRLQGAG